MRTVHAWVVCFGLIIFQCGPSKIQALAAFGSCVIKRKHQFLARAVDFDQKTARKMQDVSSSKKQSVLPSIFLTYVLLTTQPSTGLISPASANVPSDPQVMTNDYIDPFHPLCKRHIQVARDGLTFSYWGTATKGEDVIGRGCGPKEAQTYGIRKGAFTGQILPPGGRISAGDGIHEGVWEPAGTASTKLGYKDVDGIRWNDGNKWVVQQKSTATKIGEVIFWSYLGFSTLAGVKGMYDGYQRFKQRQQ